MMSDNYNLDAIPNTIFDNIIIDNSLNLDEIFDISFMQDPALDLSSIEANKSNNNGQSSAFQVDMGKVVGSEASTSSALQHDCMWSGVCQDPSHPAKAKNMKFSVKTVCREFEKELGWTSSEESETESFPEDEIAIESILEKNLPALFPTRQSIPPPPPPTPQQVPTQVVSKVISQVIPRYPPQTFTMKQHPVSIIRNQYILPPNTTIQAPPGLATQFHVFKSTPPPLKPIPTIVKVESQPANVVKFIPKVKCEPYRDPVIQQHFELHPQLKIEPVYIYNTEHLNPPRPTKPMFINYGKPLTPQKDSMINNDMKRGPKRKTDEKPSKKPAKKKLKEFDAYNCTIDTDNKILVRKSGSDTDDPLMSFDKRNMHNDMERQRRIGMRNLFVELKEAIPTLDDRERVPKVNILKEAISYCEKVKRDEKILAELRNQNCRLMTHAMRLGLSPKSIGSSTSSASSFTGGED